MQILKDEIRNAILHAALDDFYENGFSGASIRNIAKRSGISVGNFYRYYKSKDEIYTALLNPVVNKFISLIEQHDEHENIELTFEWLKNHMETQALKITELIKISKKELMILLSGSSGTQFDNIEEIIVSSLTKHIEDFIELIGNLVPKKMANILSTSIIAGYIQTIKMCIDDDNFDLILKLYFTTETEVWKTIFFQKLDVETHNKMTYSDSV